MGEKRGKLLRLNKPIPEKKSDGNNPPASQLPKDKSLTLAYQGLDGLVMESRINFQYQQPDFFHGYTAIWQINLATHETLKLGYRLNLFTDNEPSSTVNAANTLGQAKAVKLKTKQKSGTSNYPD